MFGDPLADEGLLLCWHFILCMGLGKLLDGNLGVEQEYSNSMHEDLKVNTFLRSFPGSV